MKITYHYLSREGAKLFADEYDRLDAPITSLRHRVTAYGLNQNDRHKSPFVRVRYIVEESGAGIASRDLEKFYGKRPAPWVKHRRLKTVDEFIERYIGLGEIGNV